MKTKSKNGRLMWWVAAAFALLLTAWTAMFVAASQTPVASVPLVTREAR